MAKPIRRQQVAHLLQHTLGEIFVQESYRLFGGVMITVVDVEMTPNLSLAKVYISFMLADNKKAMLKNVMQHTKEIRGFLGKKLGGKLRQIPHIQFCLDNTIEQGIRIERLINDLDLPADTDGTVSS